MPARERGRPVLRRMALFAVADDPVAARHFRRVLVTEDGCWQWTGAVMKGGYGNLVIGPMWWRAHRWFYTILVGPIPDGLEVDHLCFNGLCVNPLHLEAVTAQENSVRAAQRITHCPSGHAYTPENTRWETPRNGRRPGRSRHCRTCHRQRESLRYWARRERFARTNLERKQPRLIE